MYFTWWDNNLYEQKIFEQCDYEPKWTCQQKKLSLRWDSVNWYFCPLVFIPNSWSSAALDTTNFVHCHSWNNTNHACTHHTDTNTSNHTFDKHADAYNDALFTHISNHTNSTDASNNAGSADTNNIHHTGTSNISYNADTSAIWALSELGPGLVRQ